MEVWFSTGARGVCDFCEVRDRFWGKPIFFFIRYRGLAPLSKSARPLNWPLVPRLPVSNSTVPFLTAGQRERRSGGGKPLVRGSAQLANGWTPYSYQVVGDVFSTTLRIRFSFVKTSEFRGGGFKLHPSPPSRYANASWLELGQIPFNLQGRLWRRLHGCAMRCLVEDFSTLHRQTDRQHVPLRAWFTSHSGKISRVRRNDNSVTTQCAAATKLRSNLTRELAQFHLLACLLKSFNPLTPNDL
jgi:hypothetical protein